MAIIDKPSDYFNTVLHTGTGSEQTVSGVGFQPDFTWIKSRSNGRPNVVQDSIRGATKQLITNTSDTETSYTQYLKSFNSDGFVLGTDSFVNENNQNFVSWNWKAGTSFSNSAGANGATLASSGSVNNTSGFSIVTYVGNGSSGATIKHGLSTAPSVMFVRVYDAAAGFQVYSKAIGATKFAGYLNTTELAGTSAGPWNNTDPTSSVFTVGNGGNTNNNGGTHIAYCFADTNSLFFKGGSYIGNGSSSGNYIHLNFKPKYIMLKLVDNAQENWSIYDTVRNPINGTNDAYLSADAVNAENTNTDDLDMLSNGFKLIRAHARANSSGYNYFYYAFAENPFVTSTGVPATAR